ncbi:UPF0187 protein [Seminavis robusta]|uniref:UPF0187 protein n=1 Tax=Seminavis robusta TaxID=568900 RepID=A0A9N8HJV2_9STRA|nr:UPF0187 protein [Seminavis robusta]|eukprot:Sro712_g191410.1 UPF0187 protein (498) ;mRNA; f:38203-39819
MKKWSSSTSLCLCLSTLLLSSFLGNGNNGSTFVVAFQHLPLHSKATATSRATSHPVLPRPAATRKTDAATKKSSSTSLRSVGENKDQCNVPYEGDNCKYDYDDLLDSGLEQNRLGSMYTRFDHDNWLQHRASDRFFRNLFQSLSNYPIFQSLLDEVGLLVALSVGIIVWNALFVYGYTDFNGIYHESPIAAMEDPAFPWDVFKNCKLELPIDPFLISGGPLGLLLVFRNDASFQRYNEGFHHIEKIMSNFQNMLLMASTAIGSGGGDSGKVPTKEAQITMVKDLGGTSFSLIRTLQHELSGKFDSVAKYENDILSSYNTFASPQSSGGAQNLLSSKKKLFRAQYDIHQAIEPMTPYISILDKRTLINTVNDVALQCAESERIYTTPIPLLYTRHTLKFLTVWMSLMPFALYDVFERSWNHFLMIPCIAVLTFLFFGIEEIAVYLEEPFSILPLDEMVEEVYDSIEDVTEWMADGETGMKEVNGKLDGSTKTTNVEVA